MDRKSLFCACVFFMTIAGCNPTTPPSNDAGPGLDADTPPGVDAFVPGTDAFVPGSDAGPPGCTSDAECNDDVDCTTDTCTVATGSCRHVVTPAICGPGESCDPVAGCMMGSACATDADCADTNACTANERCDPAARVCTFQPLDGDMDGDPPRVCGGGDCDDSRDDVYAGARERCGDELDNDCDGSVDEDSGDAVQCALETLCRRQTRCSCPSCMPDVLTTNWDTCVAATRASYEMDQSWHQCADLNPVLIVAGECARGDLACTGAGSPCDSYSAFRTACTCASPLMLCEPGFCADRTSDHENCGSCGHACSGSERCVASSCVTCGVAGGPCCEVGCSGAGSCCISVTSICDLDMGTAGTCIHCGGLGERCCAGSVCATGTCDATFHCPATCPAGQTLCGGACVDTNTSATHCGGCDNPCTSTVDFGTVPGRCQAGTCVPCGQSAQACCEGSRCNREFFCDTRISGPPGLCR